MAREVVWTVPAWEDLESAANYIARDSIAYAAAFVPEVGDAAVSLSEFAAFDIQQGVLIHLRRIDVGLEVPSRGNRFPDLPQLQDRFLGASRQPKDA